MFLNLAHFPVHQACGTAQNMESPKLVWKEEGDHLGLVTVFRGFGAPATYAPCHMCE